ncbi:MAG: ATP-binding protein, partial [Acidobacteriota bacterium]
INNPINGILNYGQLIGDGLPSGSPLAGYAEGIVEESLRIAAIVGHLLAFSRQEKETHSPASLEDIIEAALWLTKAALGKDQIGLRLDVPEDLPKIKCRNQQIQQVLMNLLGNARDALNQRYAGYDPAKTLAITVRPFEEEGEAWVRTTLEDRGTGMLPQVAERAFDPFFTTKPPDQGTGLGLSVSHGIVEDHKGRLRIESREGEYTRVHLELRVDNGWSLDGSAQQDEEEMEEKEG